MAVGIILSAISIGMQLYGGYQTQKEAERQAKDEERLTREELRRMDMAFGQKMGANYAQIGAAGIEQRSVSVQRYLQEARDEFQREREFTQRAGVTSASRVREMGQRAMTSAYGGAAATGIQALYNYGSTRSNDTTTDNVDNNIYQRTDIGDASPYAQRGTGTGQGTGAMRSNWYYN